MKIIFLDIDGPMIPGRAYTLAGQTKPFVMKFDPVAVGMLNHWCETRKWKIVVHSSWLRVYGGAKTLAHCISEGLKAEHFHEDPICDEHEHHRYNRIAKWLDKHPEVTHYWILDDDDYAPDRTVDQPCIHPKDMKDHLILIDFEEGLLTRTMNMLGGGDSRVRKE
jgi:hypothetical protein